MSFLRSLGWTVDKVEQRLPVVKTTRDCFGFIDVLAIRVGDPGVLAVQATTEAHLAERVRKVKAEGRAKDWLACGNRIEVHGWARQSRGGRRTFWEPTIVSFDPV